jgi:pyrroline-5-carboxylate reductase
MPNINFLVGEGAAGITMDPRLKIKEQEIIQRLFACSGKSVMCEEKDIDIVTGLSGSGPAYIFLVIEALADGAVRMGLQRDKAYNLAAQTVIGAGKMVLEMKKHPGELKDMVTSPGGTTIEALTVLEKGGFRSLLIEAVTAATEKARSLNKPIDKK